ncbi:hypothetical protein C6P40_004019 [Pichia californica]|uniref:Magnesium transport protein CorA n=1 Tax=Pichia californica TaxID=460514 RepID=A0A9P6WRA9_9ASCO|nr:hypothetical protein C6P42_002443 [[Candida] californica]KAG0691207.1 hypothetical protein C6P40_004019 [[Candida] californica]
MKPQTYDSEDPNLPNLPDTDQIMWSDYDDYLSNRPSSSSSSSSASSHSEFSNSSKNNGHHKKNSNKKKKRTNSISNSNYKKSRRSSIISRKSDKSKKPVINIFGTHNEFIDSDDSNNVPNEYDEKEKRKENDNDYNNDGEERNFNFRRKSSNKTLTNNSSEKSSESDNSDNNDYKNRQRSGSIFSMLHFPRLIHRSSGKNNNEIIGKSANNLTKTKSEIHGKASSSSLLNQSITNSPIIQPTRAHSIAAGEINNDRKQSFNHLSPTNYYDEEAGKIIGPDEYIDRDVNYESNKHSSDSISIENSNSDALGSDYQLNSDGYEEEEEDDDDNDDDNHDNHNFIEKFSPLGRYGTTVASGSNIKRILSRNSSKRSINSKKSNNSQKSNNSKKSNSSKKSNKSSMKSNISNHKVEIDQMNRKVAKTDTDDESILHVPLEEKYQPTSILKNNIIDSKDDNISPDENLNEKGYEEDDDDDDVDEEDDEEADNGSENIEIGNINQPPTHKSRKKKAARRRRRKSRKYAGSQSKKERTAWEPGIDLRTTNVFLNSPGSIITITDYSKTRYRISHYDLFSEMNPKYSKFTTDDTIISGHDFDEGYDEKSPEFNEFLEYMNKVSDSHKEVEDAIQDKPLWSKVRWININGLSWEAISIIGKKYNLHPLSVEDLVDIPQRTKMDIYPQHLFVVMPLMKLLKIKKISSDETNESYFERLRKNIRDFAKTDTFKDFSRSPTLSNNNNNNNNKNYNKNKKAKSQSQSSSSSSPPSSAPPPTSSSSSQAPPPTSKIITKTIATREQLSREFSTNSIKSTNSNILEVPKGKTTTTPISKIMSDSTIDLNNNNKNNELNRTHTSIFNDNILPRSSKTFKNEKIYSNEEEFKLSVEIEKNSRNRRLTDLTFITPTSNKYKSRMEIINKMRPLMSKSLAIGIEQVSLYLTIDGTILSFFEHSAMDIERAILSRLSAEYTILRETCNSSILFHSVLDANVDLLYPVITAYSRILNEKELEILTDSIPDLQHTQELHLMLNELSILKNSILPISSLITQIKDLSIDLNSNFIDESCKLYLADIGDHLLAFIDEIDSMSSTIENLIDLIFNTLSVETNNSMQQLSLVSVLFLPLTFWAGYFGMNFKSFGNLDYNVSFFWKLALPFTVGMMMLLMKNSCWRLIIKFKRLLLLYWNKFKIFKNGNNNEENFYERRHQFNPEKWANFKRKMRKRD